MFSEEFFAMPEFENMETDDRPLAPDEEEYPVGCEVELVDPESARIAQSEDYWDPLMDELFRKPKLRVTVIRHSGDFSFVLCNDFEPDLKVGFSLYRACLKEPKVKFKRYIPTGTGPMPELASHSASHERYNSDDMEDFLPSAEETIPVPALVSSAEDEGFATFSASMDPSAQQLVKKGNRALIDKAYTDAIRYYTQALELDRSDASRILANRSAAHLCMKNTEQALGDAKASIRISPTHIGYTRAGNVLRLLKRFDEAKICYDRALQLKPGNKDLEFNLALNTFACVFRSRVDHMPVRITLLPTMIPVATAQKNTNAHDVAWTESATLSILAQAHRSGATGACMQCCRSLIRASSIASQVKELDVAALLPLFKETHIVECHERCGDLYCSEQCRTRAWAEHHWIECSARGRWGSAMQQCNQLCADREHRGMPLDDILLVRLAFRMLAKINSSGKELADAVGMFAWLHEGPPLTASEQELVETLLRPCHSILQTAFAREEHALFDFALLLRCFRQVRQNAVRITTSPWQSLLHRSESHTALLDLRQERSHRGLEVIRQLDPASIAGLRFSCMALFDVYSIVMNTPLPPGAIPAVTMRDETESVNNVAVIALRGVRRKEVLTGMR